MTEKKNEAARERRGLDLKIFSQFNVKILLTIFTSEIEMQLVSSMSYDMRVRQRCDPNV